MFSGGIPSGPFTVCTPLFFLEQPKVRYMKEEQTVTWAYAGLGFRA